MAEPFEVVGTESVEPGIVVCIDPDQPGKLRVCSQAYDHTVAGIISGAGGLNPGILMTQSPAEANGKYPVALTGRVYVWADATDSSIKPGELLTTSGTPGHAMKATDYSKARGRYHGQGDEFIRERAWTGSFAGGTSVMDRAHSEMYQTFGKEII